MSPLVCALSGCAVLMAAQATPVPVILDTDLGDDIDDTWALAMLLGCPQVDLKMIVTAYHDTETKTRLVAKILEKVGRTDIPIGTGIKTADRPINQAAWLGDYDLATYPGTIHKDGIEAAVDLIRASEGPVSLLVIGPQTNIPEMLKRDPSIAQKTRVVTMAGSVEIGYGGKEGRDPEWNVYADVAAARAVFGAPWEIVMAPLDSCGTLILDGHHYAHVADAETARAEAVIENYRNWANFPKHPAGQSSVLFDTVAAYLVFDEAFCTMETVKLAIDDEGNTVPDEEHGRPVRCALGWKDEAAFKKLLVEAVTGRPYAEKP